MEYSNFFKLLWRFKFTLIIFPVIAAAFTFFLIGHASRTYRSTARLATGLVERSDEFINKGGQVEGKISQEFSNIIQMLLLKKIVDRVSFQLVIHDLSKPNQSYRKYSKVVESLNPEQKRKAIATLNEKYAKMDDLSLWDDDQNLINKIIVSQKYDYESLTKKLNVYRLQTSDYIYLDFESENPVLSAFVLNTLCAEFINYYTVAINQRSNKSVVYLDSLLKVKQSSVAKKVNDLKDFKIKNGILDVNTQATVFMGQIADYQAKKQEAEKNILTYQSILKGLTTKLGSNSANSAEEIIAQANQNVADNRHWIDVLSEQYIKSNYDVKVKEKMDSLQKVLMANIAIARGATTFNNSNERQDMSKEKMNAEANLEMAKRNVVSLDSMVQYLSKRLDMLTPSQANIQVYEKDIDNQGKEYEELMNKLNQTKLESSFSTTLRQVEMAMPEIARPSKKLLLVALSAVVSFLLAVAVLFIIFYFDHSIVDSQQLSQKTQQDVIGSLSLVSPSKLQGLNLWEMKIETHAMKTFKSQLRSIRFEVDNRLSGSKIIALTSLQPHEGKTFLAYNLALAYKTISKKVLLIDGNFDNPEISSKWKPEILLESFLSRTETALPAIGDKNYELIVMGNRGNDISLLETSNYSTIEARFTELKAMFDIILIDIPSLDTFNKAREWIGFSDKVICVFSSGNSMRKESDKELQYLNSLNGKLMGWVINRIPLGKNKGRNRPTKKSV